MKELNKLIDRVTLLELYNCKHTVNLRKGSKIVLRHEK